MNEQTPLSELKGVGEKTSALLKKRGLFCVSDLLQYYPRGYEYFSPPVSVSEALPGEVNTLRLTVIGSGSVFRAAGKSITNFRAADATGMGLIRITYFNMPYIRRNIHAGDTRLFRGIVKRYQNGSLQLEQPACYSEEEYSALQGTFLPRYSVPRGISSRQLAKLTARVTSSFPFQEDYLPEELRLRMKLMPFDDAIRKIHFPATTEELTDARNRRVFDEFFTFLTSLKQQKAAGEELKNERPLLPVADTGRLIEALPYRLTGAQQRAWREIEKDLCGNTVMNRLLQGDVGSGKTILAFLALLMSAANGRQGALMAPTEVLAAQHMEDLVQLTERYQLPIRPVLLTGSVTGAGRREVYQKIESGEANVIIGTHALIQEKVRYRDLSLVITDEQHRFGVRQRESLAGKGKDVPVLVMSATPIPRTLAIILYGDLCVSILDEMPKDRLPIRNLAMPQADGREKAYRFLYKQILAGRQGYIICPAVEEGELTDIENVADYTERLRKVMPETVQLASLNGRMKPAEKNRIMTAFAAHEIDILVSTTVIEVGINVPNATVILIENAERFGLSQLHQLRGRVGRGKEQSYCIFLYAGEGEKPKRLEILEQSNDGFFIAQEDLKLRGPGDLFGVRQSGELGFVLADIYEDADILKKAAVCADEVLQNTPDYRPVSALAAAKPVDFRSI